MSKYKEVEVYVGWDPKTKQVLLDVGQDVVNGTVLMSRQWAVILIRELSNALKELDNPTVFITEEEEASLKGTSTLYEEAMASRAALKKGRRRDRPNKN